MQHEPEFGTTCGHIDNCLCALTEIQGPPNTPYEKGTFVLDLEVPERWVNVLVVVLHGFWLNLKIPSCVRADILSNLHVSVS